MRILIYLLTTAFFALPAIVTAQGNVYSPLVDLSNAGQGNQVQTFEQYINFLYGMSIAVAALLAVIKIVIAGAKYMLSDVISNKGEALKDIQGAVLGLLLILSAVIILELINPQLTQKNITFPDLQSPRGALSPLASLTVAGAGASIEAAAQAALGGGCGDNTRHDTEQHLVFTKNATTCSDPAAALGIFAQECMRNGGQLSTRGADLTSSCSIPKTGLGAGGRTPNIEFSMGNYDANFRVCGIGVVVPIYNTTMCSQEAVLSEAYIDREASVGSTIVYDAEKACKDELRDSLEEDYLSRCIQTMEELLFTTCNWEPGSTCDSGWCIHNAGQKTNGAGLGKFSCALPYQRFTRDQVITKYRETTATGQQSSTVTEQAFQSGCQGLQGTSVKISLYETGSIDDLRCVKR